MTIIKRNSLIPLDGPGSLTPRAVAAMCALRSGPKTTKQLHVAIGDRKGGGENTRLLLVQMAERGVIVSRGPSAPSKAWSAVWYITHDGLGWLQSHGLDAVREACIWSVEEAQVMS